MLKSIEKIEFRRFEKRDVSRCADLAVDAWPIVLSLVSLEDVSKLMRAYVEINQVASTWLEVAILDNKIVGFLFGRLDVEQKLVDRLRALFPSLLILLKIIIGRYGKLAEPIVFLKHLFATEQKVQQHTPQADGEIVLFVVDAKYRGKGIGRSLLNRFLKKAKFMNARLISVYTDPLSNWQFYEKFGFIRHGAFIDDLNTYIKKDETKGIIYKLTL